MYGSADLKPLCRRRAPLGQRGGAMLFEDVAAVWVAVVVEVIVNRGDAHGSRRFGGNSYAVQNFGGRCLFFVERNDGKPHRVRKIARRWMIECHLNFPRRWRSQRERVRQAKSSASDPQIVQEYIEGGALEAPGNAGKSECEPVVANIVDR